MSDEENICYGKAYNHLRLCQYIHFLNVDNQVETKQLYSKR